MRKSQKIVVIDYAGGNLASAQRALQKAASLIALQADISITNNPSDIENADRLVLPGQGSFPDCMHGLKQHEDMLRSIHKSVSNGHPFLGICVGMQIMAQAGYEDAFCPGLGWFKGEIRKISSPLVRIPQMGWNDLFIEQSHPLTTGLGDNPNVYFVHSYALTDGSKKERIAHTQYGGTIPAVISRDNVAGTQFHVEKSQEVGLKILANFLQWQPRTTLNTSHPITS